MPHTILCVAHYGTAIHRCASVRAGTPASTRPDATARVSLAGGPPGTTPSVLFAAGAGDRRVPAGELARRVVLVEPDVQVVVDRHGRVVARHRPVERAPEQR